MNKKRYKDCFIFSADICVVVGVKYVQNKNDPECFSLSICKIYCNNANGGTIIDY